MRGNIVNVKLKLLITAAIVGLKPSSKERQFPLFQEARPDVQVQSIQKNKKFELGGIKKLDGSFISN